MKHNRQLDALAAICDTFIPAIHQPDDPAGYWARSASDAGVPARIFDAIALAKLEDQVQFKQLLSLLASPMLGLTWGGPLKPAYKLTPAQRHTMLRRWANSPLSDLRNGFNTLRKLTGLIYFGDSTADARSNPAWSALGYVPVPPQPHEPPRLPVSFFPSSGVLRCEVLVIGSGAGGSVVAAQLAAAGKAVVVVDKGGFVAPQDMDQREFPSLQRHFEAGGLLASADGSATILAGSTLGGGTTVNWAATLRTPDYVLEEWASFGNSHFVDTSYKNGFDWVEQRNNVNTNAAHNPQNNALLTAGQQLGYQVGSIPLNIRFPETLPADTSWKSLGFSCFGDRYGIKQGAVQSFLPDAVAQGAQVYPSVHIQQITIKNGGATGATGLFYAPDGRAHPVTIHADKVVVASGALHTPVLLLKSGLRHNQIGQNLYLHPVAATAALMPYETHSWYGPMMSVIVREFERLEGNWGVRLECPPLHPGLAAFALNWEDGYTFKSMMTGMNRLAVNIALTRDKFGGKVSVGKMSGKPVIHYKLHDFDKKHLLKGLQEAVRLHEAAGAEQIVIPHNRSIHYYPGRERLEDCLVKMQQRKWRANDFGLFSAHQMGTCRMGGSSREPVKPNGETREVRQLFVADGSLFPSASGVNPMLSIQALAYHVAQHI